MDNPVTRISVRNLVEFILQSGDLDNRRGTIDKDAMLKGSRLHRKLQKQMGGDYRAEVALRMNYSYEDLDIRLEGRADGIFTEDEVVWIDEIKGIYGNVEQLEEPVKVHKAQAMCYGYIYGVQEGLSKIGIQMTYANLETEVVKRFREVISIEELKEWYQKLLDEYHKWLSYQKKWKEERNHSLQSLEFPFFYRDGEQCLPCNWSQSSDFYSDTYRCRKNYVYHISGSSCCWRRERGDDFLSYCQDYYQNSGSGSF